MKQGGVEINGERADVKKEVDLSKSGEFLVRSLARKNLCGSSSNESGQAVQNTVVVIRALAGVPGARRF